VGNSLRIRDALAEATARLRDAQVAEARREAASLLAHALGRDRTYLITHAEETISRSTLEAFRTMLARRASGEPLQYITGRQEFWGLEFVVTPDVLIPRPETELIVEAALEAATDRAMMICDVGTGSGCIAVALLKEKICARAIGLDISAAALRVAAHNARRHNVADRFMLVASDCFAALDEESARFDLVVANPPYVAERDLPRLQREVRDFEPRLALTAGPDELRLIRRLLTDAPRFLRAGGHLIFEIGCGQTQAVRKLIDARWWSLLDIKRDLQGIARTVCLRRL